MTATHTHQGGRMAAHVHPETYQASDPLDWRIPQLHTKRAQCELSECTFQDLIPAAQVEYVEQAKALRAELRKAGPTATQVLHQELAQQPTQVTAQEEAKAKRKAVPNSERRNETTHPDGAAAVAHGKCPACGARKGTLCTAATGKPTKHVHAGRMKAWEKAAK